MLQNFRFLPYHFDIYILALQNAIFKCPMHHLSCRGNASTSFTDVRGRVFKRQLLHAPFSAECPVMRLMTRKYTLPLAKSTQTFKEMRLSYSGKYGDPRDLSILP